MLERLEAKRGVMSGMSLNPMDVPLYDEGISMLAHEECLRAEAGRPGDLVPHDRLLEKLILKDGLAQIQRVFRETAGYQDPEVPDADQREMMEEGLLET